MSKITFKLMYDSEKDYVVLGEQCVMSLDVFTKSMTEYAEKLNATVRIDATDSEVRATIEEKQ